MISFVLKMESEMVSLAARQLFFARNDPKSIRHSRLGQHLIWRSKTYASARLQEQNIVTNAGCQVQVV